MSRLGAVVCLAALALAASPCKASVYYSVQTDITGAQTQIDVNHTSTWQFSTGADWSFGGGTFTMKEGPKTSADIVLSIYEGTNTTGTLVGSVNLTSADFCAQNSSCQSFSNVQFLFPTALSLATNHTYFVNLTSSAVDTSSDQYFIKGSNSSLAFQDSNGNPIPSSYVTSVSYSNSTPTSPTSVPEPSGFALIGTGLFALVLAKRTRSLPA